MAKRQRIWAARVRAKLFAALGWQCALCGSGDDLTFDCIVPTGHTRNKSGKEPSARASHYRKQFAAGNLQVLCRTCNGRKGDVEPRQLELSEAVPF